MTAPGPLRPIWTALGGDPAVLDRVEVVGDASMPSCFAVTDLGTAAFAAAGAAVAEFIAAAGGDPPRVRVDRDLCSGWLRGGSRLVAPTARQPSVFHRISTDYPTADHRWIRFQANYRHLRAATLAALGTGEDPDEIAALIARHDADEIERVIVEGGGAAAASRRLDQWAGHPQGRAVAGEPLIDVAAGDLGDPGTGRTVAAAARPLSGVRVLDVTRVLAGPMATRFLAGYGAEVLRIDPPGYREPGGPGTGDLTLGKRCAYLDLRTGPGRRSFLDLLAGADVLVHGLRPDALDRLGLDRATRCAARPGLVEVALSAYGWSGPWRDRRGFDTLVQSSTGMADAAMRWAGSTAPARFPISILDHATGYLMAAAAVRGLHRRLVTGAGSVSRLSLARTAALLASAGAPADAPPEVVPLPGPLEDRMYGSPAGPVRRLRWPVTVDGAPFFWERPGDPYGSAAPCWVGGG